MHLSEFDRKRLRSIENEVHDRKDDTNTVDAKSMSFLVIFFGYGLIVFVRATRPATTARTCSHTIEFLQFLIVKLKIL